MSFSFLHTLAQTTTPPGGPWPGALTYVGLGMLILAAVIYFLTRRAPPDDSPPPDDKE